MPADGVRRISHAEAEIMVPVDIQGQYTLLAVRDTEDMLAVQASADIAAGATGNVDITVPSGELWEITCTNHIGSGADISLKTIYVSPNGGTTFIPVKAGHIAGERIFVSGGNVIRAEFANAGTAAETAVFNVIGRKLKTSV